MKNEVKFTRIVKCLKATKMGREQKRESILTANKAEDEQRKRNERGTKRNKRE